MSLNENLSKQATDLIEEAKKSLANGQPEVASAQAALATAIFARITYLYR